MSLGRVIGTFPLPIFKRQTVEGERGQILKAAFPPKRESDYGTHIDNNFMLNISVQSRFETWFNQLSLLRLINSLNLNRDQTVKEWFSNKNSIFLCFRICKHAPELGMVVEDAFPPGCQRKGNASSNMMLAIYSNMILAISPSAKKHMKKGEYFFQDGA